MAKHKKSLPMLFVFIFSSVQVQAVSIPQDPDPAYTQVINGRAQKIVETLGITDADKALQDLTQALQDKLHVQYLLTRISHIVGDYLPGI